MTRLMTTTALALTLAAGTAFAESHTNGEQMEQNLENAGESLEQAGENAAAATENAAEDAAQATEEAYEDAAEATENAAETAAEATENAAETTAEAAENAADATAAAASDATAEAADMADNDTNMIRVRDIMGGEIYSVDAQNGVVEFSTQSYDAMGEDWQNIGEIEDIVLSSDGKITGIVAEVGGFLNIGDKHVFLPMENVKLVPVEDANYKVVVGYSEEQLEQMQAVDEAFWN